MMHIRMYIYGPRIAKLRRFDEPKGPSSFLRQFFVPQARSGALRSARINPGPSAIEEVKLRWVLSKRFNRVLERDSSSRLSCRVIAITD